MYIYTVWCTRRFSLYRDAAWVGFLVGFICFPERREVIQETGVDIWTDPKSFRWWDEGVEGCVFFKKNTLRWWILLLTSRSAVYVFYYPLNVCIFLCFFSDPTPYQKKVYIYKYFLSSVYEFQPKPVTGPHMRVRVGGSRVYQRMCSIVSRTPYARAPDFRCVYFILWCVRGFIFCETHIYNVLYTHTYVHVYIIPSETGRLNYITYICIIWYINV